MPGGDVNPYLAVAGMVAAGLDGITRGLSLEDPFVGNAYASDSAHVPSSMAEALTLWEGSTWVRDTFGAEVQEHYANMARVEIAAYGKAVKTGVIKKETASRKVSHLQIRLNKLSAPAAA